MGADQKSIQFIIGFKTKRERVDPPHCLPTRALEVSDTKFGGSAGYCYSELNIPFLIRWRKRELRAEKVVNISQMFVIDCYI